MREFQEMKVKAASNYERVKSLGVDLEADYERTTPPPHGSPFNGVRAVWGVQLSGKSGFVIAEDELPY
jgi:hypothetical protein